MVFVFWGTRVILKSGICWKEKMEGTLIKSQGSENESHSCTCGMYVCMWTMISTWHGMIFHYFCFYLWFIWCLEEYAFMWKPCCRCWRVLGLVVVEKIINLTGPWLDREVTDLPLALRCVTRKKKKKVSDLLSIRRNRWKLEKITVGLAIGRRFWKKQE